MHRSKTHQKLSRARKGQALVEYALIIAGVALISAASVSIFGHKTTDLISAIAAVLPCAHADDNGSIQSGKLIETTAATATDPITLNVTAIDGAAATGRLDANVLGSDGSTDGFGGLVSE